MPDEEKQRPYNYYTKSIDSLLSGLKLIGQVPTLINCDTIAPGYIYRMLKIDGRRYISARLADGRWYEGFWDRY